MNKLSLPNFKYHPDPIASGVIEQNDSPCIVCNQSCGFIYTGMFYSIEEDIENICPWCIKDGSAAEKYDGEFFDDTDLEDVDNPEMIDELIKRTPGFYPARETWPSHCGEFCKLIGEVEYSDIENRLEELNVDIVRLVNQLEISREDLISDLKKEDSPLWAHLFQCLHCGQHRLIADYE